MTTLSEFVAANPDCPELAAYEQALTIINSLDLDSENNYRHDLFHQALRTVKDMPELQLRLWKNLCARHQENDGFSDFFVVSLRGQKNKPQLLEQGVADGIKALLAGRIHHNHKAFELPKLLSDNPELMRSHVIKIVGRLQATISKDFGIELRNNFCLLDNFVVLDRLYSDDPLLQKLIVGTAIEAYEHLKAYSEKSFGAFADRIPKALTSLVCMTAGMMKDTETSDLQFTSISHPEGGSLTYIPAWDEIILENGRIQWASSLVDQKVREHGASDLGQKYMALAGTLKQAQAEITAREPKPDLPTYVQALKAKLALTAN